VDAALDWWLMIGDWWRFAIQMEFLMTEAFDPKIVTFACNWCAYSAADLAGVSRFQYPPNMRIIRVMCSGRVNPNFLLKAFQRGADGVLVAGWHFGDCHYLDGNVKAEKMFMLTQELIKILGLDPERLRLEWISSAEGTRFAEVAREFTDKIRSLGSATLKQAA
jgi:F420-non-reducing hydrogenase iron-sulfur subunit